MNDTKTTTAESGPKRRRKYRVDECWHSYNNPLGAMIRQPQPYQRVLQHAIDDLAYFYLDPCYTLLEEP